MKKSKNNKTEQENIQIINVFQNALNNNRNKIKTQEANFFSLVLFHEFSTKK